MENYQIIKDQMEKLEAVIFNLKDGVAGCRELAIALTHLDTAGLWLQHLVRIGQEQSKE